MTLEPFAAAREALPWWVGWGPTLVLAPASALAGAAAGVMAARLGARARLLVALAAPALALALATKIGPLSAASPTLLGAVCSAAALFSMNRAGKLALRGSPRLGLAAPTVLLAVSTAPVALGSARERGLEGEPKALASAALTGGSASSLDELAWLRLGRGDRAGAHALFRAAAAASPSAGIYPAHLAWALAEAGRCEEARAALDEARAKGGPAGGHGGRGTDPAAALERCRMATASSSSGRVPEPPRPAASASSSGRPSTPPQSAAPWLKGQLHMHSSGSKDSRTPPEEAARWYEERGYDFIVFTDHNRVTAPGGSGSMLAFAGVELSQNYRWCEPPPDLPRDRCILHMNALFAAVPQGEETFDFARGEGEKRVDLYQREIDIARRLGAMAQINHPNYHHVLTGSLIAELSRRGALLLEIANEAIDSANEGDATHPSTEALWDAALSEGVTLWGTATDDAHHYFDADHARDRGEVAHIGDRGWVMVRAEKDERAIRSAIERGDFYSSSGVLLKRVEVVAGSLEVEVEPGAHGDEIEIAMIGQGGKVLAKQRGPLGRYPLPAEGYVRAVATGHRGKKAWTQPFRRGSG